MGGGAAAPAIALWPPLATALALRHHLLARAAPTGSQVLANVSRRPLPRPRRHPPRRANFQSHCGCRPVTPNEIKTHHFQLYPRMEHIALNKQR